MIVKEVKTKKERKRAVDFSTARFLTLTVPR